MIPFPAVDLPSIDPKSYEINGPVALLIVVLLGGLFAVVKGWVVPKPYYDKEVKRADDLTEQNKKTNDVLQALTKEVRIYAGGKGREDD